MTATDGEDLGALLARAARRVVDAERPLLAARGLTMWGYITLSRLARGPAPTQLVLAEDIGHDKTRLIGVLDTLEGEGLVVRRPDPADRRARVVALTPKGRRRLEGARADIRAMEAEVLSGASAPERRVLRTVLARLGG